MNAKPTTTDTDNGLTVEELAEAITHLAFYAGWPNAMTASRPPRSCSHLEINDGNAKMIFSASDAPAPLEVSPP